MTLQIGIARADITPPIGIEMIGFAGRDPSFEVHDALHATALAVGEGETLTTLADLMGIAEADRASFYGLTQARFGQIFPSDDVTSGQMLANLGVAMAGDAKLARYVRG